MNHVNHPEYTSTPSCTDPDLIRALMRMAPILGAVMALSACTQDIDPRLQACQIETARLVGLLEGVDIAYEPSPTGTLPECLVAQARVQGVVQGITARDRGVRVKLEAMGLRFDFELPGSEEPTAASSGDASGGGAVPVGPSHTPPPGPSPSPSYQSPAEAREARRRGNDEPSPPPSNLSDQEIEDLLP